MGDGRALRRIEVGEEDESTHDTNDEAVRRRWASWGVPTLNHMSSVCDSADMLSLPEGWRSSRRTPRAHEKYPNIQFNSDTC